MKNLTVIFIFILAFIQQVDAQVDAGNPETSGYRTIKEYFNDIDFDWNEMISDFDCYLTEIGFDLAKEPKFQTYYSYLSNITDYDTVLIMSEKMDTELQKLNSFYLPVSNDKNNPRYYYPWWDKLYSDEINQIKDIEKHQRNFKLFLVLKEISIFKHIIDKEDLSKIITTYSLPCDFENENISMLLMCFMMPKIYHSQNKIDMIRQEHILEVKLDSLLNTYELKDELEYSFQALVAEFYPDFIQENGTVDIIKFMRGYNNWEISDSSLIHNCKNLTVKHKLKLLYNENSLIKKFYQFIEEACLILPDTYENRSIFGLKSIFEVILNRDELTSSPIILAGYRIIISTERLKCSLYRKIFIIFLLQKYV